MNKTRLFGRIQISPGQIFFESEKSFAFVNIKPVLPGHVLVAPKRIEPEYSNLSVEEISDLMIAVKHVNKCIMETFSGTSSTITIQNGPEAGQTVPHVHVHVMPRQSGDFENNDDIYKEIENHDKDDRIGRSKLSMEEEANLLRKKINEMIARP